MATHRSRSILWAWAMCVACDAPPADPAPAATGNADETTAPTLVPAVAPEPIAEPAVDPAPSSTPATPATLEPAAEASAGLPLERPERFGEIRPPRPPPSPESLTTHGLAGFEVVAIHAAPDLASPRLGYLRFGQRVMVTPRIDDEGTECPKGFHGVGAGGFVCASKGFLVDDAKPPYMYLPPPPPRLDDPIPYDYGVIAQDGTPLWWKMADAEEVALAAERYAAIVEATAPPPDAAEPVGHRESNPEEPPTVQGPPPVELTPEQKEQRRRKAARLPLNSKSPFLEAGFVITLGEKVRDQGRSWWRTTRGAFVQSSKVWRKKTSDFHGGPLPAGTGPLFGFVMEEVASASAISKRGKLEWKRKLGFRELMLFTAEVEVDGRPYLVTADGLHLRASDVRLARPATRPEQVRPYERWIDVDLERQILVAYEGDVPVYATLVSTGKKGTAEESFLTPVGKFRITTKHVSSSMDGDTASDGAYSIQDVPWAMFFHGNFALHGAFWHGKFGARRSHGCVNLGPTDARWLFYWTTPFVPENWHGVSSHDGAPGSMVVVH